MRNYKTTTTTTTKTTNVYYYSTLNDLANDSAKFMVDNERIDEIEISLTSSSWNEFDICFIKYGDNTELNIFTIGYIQDEDTDYDIFTPIITSFLATLPHNLNKCKEDSCKQYENHRQNEAYVRENDVDIIADSDIIKIRHLRDSVDIWNQILIELCNLVDSTSIDI